MAARRRPLYDRRTFTSSTSDEKIEQPRNLVGLEVTVNQLQNGATAPTLATGLGTLDLFQLRRNGVLVTEMEYAAALAYNILAMGNEPISVVSVSDNDNQTLPAVRLPINAPAGGDTWAWRGIYASVSTVDTQQLTVEAVEQDAGLEGGVYYIPRYVYTPAASGNYLRALNTSFPGALTGLMVFSTTIPLISSLNTSARKIRVKAAGEIQVEALWAALQATNKYPGDSGLRGVVDNYAYLSLENDPIPANTGIEVEVYADDTNAVRLYPVVRV